MTWDDLFLAVGKAQDSLPPVTTPEMQEFERVWARHPKYLIEWFEKWKKTTEASIRVYTRTGNWPEMSEDEILLLHLRLGGASDFAEGLICAGRMLGLAVPNRAEEDLIEWAMIDLWEVCGIPATDDKVRCLAAALVDGRNTDGLGKKDS